MMIPTAPQFGFGNYGHYKSSMGRQQSDSKKLEVRNLIRSNQKKMIMKDWRKKLNAEHFCIMATENFSDIHTELTKVSIEISVQSEDIYAGFIEYVQSSRLTYLKLSLEGLQKLTSNMVKSLNKAISLLTEINELEIIFGFQLIETDFIDLKILNQCAKLEKLYLTIRSGNNFGESIKSLCQRILPATLKTFSLQIEDSNNLSNCSFHNLFSENNQIQNLTLTIGSRNNFVDKDNSLMRELQKLTHLRTFSCEIKNGNYVDYINIGLHSAELEKLQLILGRNVSAVHNCSFKIALENLTELYFTFEGLNGLTNDTVEQLANSLESCSKLRFLKLRFGSLNKATNYHMISQALDKIPELNSIQLQFGDNNRIENKFLINLREALMKSSSLKKLSLIVKPGHMFDSESFDLLEKFHKNLELEDLYLDISSNNEKQLLPTGFALVKNLRINCLNNLNIKIFNSIQLTYAKGVKVQAKVSSITRQGLSDFSCLMSNLTSEKLQLLSLTINALSLDDIQDFSHLENIWYKNSPINKIKIVINNTADKLLVEQFRWFLEWTLINQYQKLTFKVKQKFSGKKITLQTLPASKLQLLVQDHTILTQQMCNLLLINLKNQQDRVVELNLEFGKLNVQNTIDQQSLKQIYLTIIEFKYLIKCTIQITHTLAALNVRINQFNQFLANQIKDRLRVLKGYNNILHTIEPLNLHIQQILPRLLLFRTERQVNNQVGALGMPHYRQALYRNVNLDSDVSEQDEDENILKLDDEVNKMQTVPLYGDDEYSEGQEEQPYYE